MRKLLVSLVLIAGLAVGGIKGYLWYQVTASADDFAAAVAPFAELTYGGIHTSLKGRVGIDKVVIKPRGFDDEIYIGSVSFEAPDLRFLLTSGLSLRDGELPRRLAVSAEGFRVSTVGPLADFAMAAAARQPQGPLMPLEGCGNRRIGLNELAQMGYTRMGGDSRVSYERVGDSRLRVQARWDSPDMSSGELEFDLILAGFDGKLRQLPAAQPKLDTLQIRYADQGYNQRLSEFCAESLDITPAAFVERQAATARALLEDLGVQLDAAAAATLGQMFEAGSQTRIVLAPPTPVDPAELGFYQPAQLLSLLQPRLTVNGAPLELPLAPPRSTPPPRAAAAATPVQPEAPPQRQQADAAPRYRAVALDELAQHVGWPVRVSLHSGRSLEGTLEAAGDDQAVLRRRFGGGTMSQPVDYSEISAAAVLRP